MWYTALKNLSKCFSMTLVRYEAAPLDGFSEYYGYRSQEPRGVIHSTTVLQHNIMVCVQGPNMAAVKRHAYEADFKLKAVSHAVEHGNRAAAREFNINESMVRKWRKQEDDLRRVKKTKQSFRGNKARWQQLEDKLEQWVIEERRAGRSVSTVSIRLKATVVAGDMKINNFRGGPSWCFRFMKRRHISIRTRTTISQQLPTDCEEKLDIFCCKNEITEMKIRPEHVTNMDEVPLTFDIPMNHTVEKTGTSSVSTCTTGNEESSFTVDLGSQANGQKLPPMVVFKRKTLPKQKCPAGVIIKANPKIWMDEEKMRSSPVHSPACTSSAISPAPPEVRCGTLLSSPPSLSEPSVDSTSFWKSCNVAGCTQSIFTDFVDEMNEISRRIQSDQASQEDYDRALKVMEASGKLAKLVAKQQKDLQRKQMELQKAAAAMKEVVSALKR